MSLKIVLKKKHLKILVAVLACLGLFIGGFEYGTWQAVASYIADLTEPWLTAPYSPYTYTIGQYNSTHYYMKNGTGYGLSAYKGYEYMNSNASKVADFAWNNLTSGGTVFWKAGTFNIAKNPTIRYSNIVNIGEGKSSKLNFTAASASIKITSASNLDGIGFYKMNFEGNDLANYAVDSSGMGNTKRVRWFTLEDCKVYNFVTVAFNMLNPELQTFTRNDFYDNGVDIRLYNTGYSHGNIFVSDNFFGHHDTGEYAIKVESDNASATFANFESQSNHYYADATVLPDVEMIFINASAGRIDSVISDQDRTENSGLFNGTIDSSVYVVGIHIENGYIDPAAGATTRSFVGVELPLRSRDSLVEGNTFSMGSKTTGVRDRATSTTYYNTVSGNDFYDDASGAYGGMINGTLSTHAFGNTYSVGAYSQVPVGQKSTSHRNGQQITYWGSNTGGWANKTVYTVQTCDVLLTIPSTNIITIVVKDWQGNTYISGVTSLTNELIPYHFTVNMTFSSTPTLTIFFKG